MKVLRTPGVLQFSYSSINLESNVLPCLCMAALNRFLFLYQSRVAGLDQWGPFQVPDFRFFFLSHLWFASEAWWRVKTLKCLQSSSPGRYTWPVRPSSAKSRWETSGESSHACSSFELPMPDEFHFEAAKRCQTWKIYGWSFSGTTMRRWRSRAPRSTVGSRPRSSWSTWHHSTDTRAWRSLRALARLPAAVQVCRLLLTTWREIMHRAVSSVELSHHMNRISFCIHGVFFFKLIYLFLIFLWIATVRFQWLPHC